MVLLGFTCLGFAGTLPVKLLAVQGVNANPSAPGRAYERSLQMANEALQVRPGDPRFLLILARVHFRWGQFRAAIPAYEDLLRRDPRQVEALVDLAECHARLEEPGPAMETYRRVLATDHLAARLAAHRALADLLFKQGLVAEAAAQLRQGVAEGLDGASVRFQLGRALSIQAQQLRDSPGTTEQAVRLDQEARAELERAIALDGNHQQAHYLLSAVARRQGDHELARTAMERFKAVRAPHEALEDTRAERSELQFQARTAIQISRAFLQAGDVGRALQLQGVALKVDPGFIEAVIHQGWVAWKLGRRAEAERAYARALQLDPRSQEALVAAGSLKLEAGAGQEAHDLLARAAALPHPPAEAFELLAILAVEKDVEPARAEEYSLRAWQLKPTPPACLRVMFVLHREGKLKEALLMVEEGLRRFPGDANLVAAARDLRSEAARR